MTQDTKRGFTGVFIPRIIWEDTNLNWTEKLFLAEIQSFDANGECFASNEYFAKFFNLSKSRVSKVISSLKDKGFVDVNLIYKDGTKEVLKRVIKPLYGYGRKVTEGMVENSDTYSRLQLDPMVENSEDIKQFIKYNNIQYINNNSLFPSTEENSSKPKKAKVEKVLSHKELVCKEAHKLVIDYFCLEYRPNYVFSGGKDATAVKGIISKIYDVQNKTSEPTVEVILSIFKLICAWLPTQNDFFKTADLPTINSKFNTIIESIKSKHYGASTFESKQSRFDKFC